MKRIALTINELELGYLSDYNGKYMFNANSEIINKAKEQYPIDMLLFSLNTTGMETYNELPYPFTQFMSGVVRADIINKAKILDEDTDFMKLFKLAGLKLMRENFEIHQVN